MDHYKLCFLLPLNFKHLLNFLLTDFREYILTPQEEERSKQAAPVEDGVLELNEDGSFDTAAAPTPVTAATAAADSSTPPAAPPVATSIMDGPSPDIPSGETPEEEAERIKREEEEDKEPPRKSTRRFSQCTAFVKCSTQFIFLNIQHPLGALFIFPLT